MNVETWTVMLRAGRRLRGLKATLVDKRGKETGVWGKYHKVALCNSCILPNKTFAMFKSTRVRLAGNVETLE
jgi:hypothetical protein